MQYTLEIVGFGDEEGVRFPATLVGEVKQWLDSLTRHGSIRSTPKASRCVKRSMNSLVTQSLENWIVATSSMAMSLRLLSRISSKGGPAERGLAVGVVTAIAGATRMRLNVTGLAGHAGTVPMGARQTRWPLRRNDLFVERFCTDNAGLIGTVGKLSVKPGAINVIPQDVEFTIDVRSGDDATRAVALNAFATGCLPS